MKKTIRIVSKPIEIEERGSTITHIVGYGDIIGEHNLEYDVVMLCAYYLKIAEEDLSKDAKKLKHKFVNLFTVEEIN